MKKVKIKRAKASKPKPVIERPKPIRWFEVDLETRRKLFPMSNGVAQDCLRSYLIETRQMARPIEPSPLPAMGAPFRPPIPASKPARIRIVKRKPGREGHKAERRLKSKLIANSKVRSEPAKVAGKSKGKVILIKKGKKR